MSNFTTFKEFMENQSRILQEIANARNAMIATIPTHFPLARWTQRYVSAYFNDAVEERYYHQVTFTPYAQFRTRYIKFMFLRDFTTEAERYHGMMELEEVFRWMKVQINPIRVVPNGLDQIPAFEWNIFYDSVLSEEEIRAERAAQLAANMTALS